MNTSTIVTVCSINGYKEATGLSNVLAPVWIDTTHSPTEWAGGTLADQKASYDIITCVNMLHISEWASSVVGRSKPSATSVYLFIINICKNHHKSSLSCLWSYRIIMVHNGISQLNG